ncbi:ribosomal protein S6 kinase delta 1 [Sesbania bispinosa]|nr:ribosomal protein S6 kinase delta 1 [Sesbania bispinosa]
MRLQAWGACWPLRAAAALLPTGKGTKPCGRADEAALAARTMRRCVRRRGERQREVARARSEGERPLQRHDEGTVEE